MIHSTSSDRRHRSRALREPKYLLYTWLPSIFADSASVVPAPRGDEREKGTAGVDKTSAKSFLPVTVATDEPFIVHTCIMIRAGIHQLIISYCYTKSIRDHIQLLDPTMHAWQEKVVSVSLFPYTLNVPFYFIFAYLNHSYILNHNLIFETFYIFELLASSPL